MLSVQILIHGVLWGLIFSAVFCVATLIIARIDAVMLLNDYPPDIRLKYGPMSAATRRRASLAGLPLLASLLAVIVFALLQLRRIAGELTPLNTFIALVVMLELWNLADLLVLDWAILLGLKPAFMILPGTEGMPGYRDYAFHWRKFLKGIPLTLVLSVVIAALALGVEFLF